MPATPSTGRAAVLQTAGMLVHCPPPPGPNFPREDLPNAQDTAGCRTAQPIAAGLSMFEQAKSKKRRESALSGNQTSAVVVLAIVGALGGILWWRRRNQPSDKPAGKGSSFRFPKPAPSSSLPRSDVFTHPGQYVRHLSQWRAPHNTRAVLKSSQEQGSEVREQQEAAEGR